MVGRPLGQLASTTLISVTCQWEFFPGWVLSHFIVGFVGLLWCALWLWFGHPKAPCGGCVYECNNCCGKKDPPKIPVCTKRLIMMKVWSAVAKQSAVWGIVFAWSATDLMWMLLETYVTVLNKINFMNEIWTSAALLVTCATTVLTGVIADRIINHNPETYRYIRKIFDSLGKVFVIILAIVMVRLQFNCSKWYLVMSVIVIVTSIHCLQYAGCYSNCVDIGDPCTGVTVSMAMIFSSLSRLAMWNGLFYSVSFDMDLLTFQPPLYAISAILAASIVIYALFGSPDINLYLPANWDSLISAQEGQGSCSICCLSSEPHKHIMQIMDQACRASLSRQTWRPPSGPTPPPGPTYRHVEDGKTYDGRPRGSVVSFSDCPSMRRASIPTTSILRQSHSPPTEPRVQFSDNRRPAGTPGENEALDSDRLMSETEPVLRHKVPTVRLEDTDDDSDWPPPPTFQQTREQHSGHVSSMDRRSPRLQRADAMDKDESDGHSMTTPPWLRAESQL